MVGACRFRYFALLFQLDFIAEEASDVLDASLQSIKRASTSCCLGKGRCCRGSVSTRDDGVGVVGDEDQDHVSARAGSFGGGFTNVVKTIDAAKSSHCA